jgi:hypothetical protein
VSADRQVSTKRRGFCSATASASSAPPLGQTVAQVVVGWPPWPRAGARRESRSGPPFDACVLLLCLWPQLVGSPVALFVPSPEPRGSARAGGGWVQGNGAQPPSAHSGAPRATPELMPRGRESRVLGGLAPYQWPLKRPFFAARAPGLPPCGRQTSRCAAILECALDSPAGARIAHAFPVDSIRFVSADRPAPVTPFDACLYVQVMPPRKMAGA